MITDCVAHQAKNPLGVVLDGGRSGREIFTLVCKPVHLACVEHKKALATMQSDLSKGTPKQKKQSNFAFNNKRLNYTLDKETCEGHECFYCLVRHD